MISLVQIVEAMEGPIAVNGFEEGAQVACMVIKFCFYEPQLEPGEFGGALCAE